MIERTERLINLVIALRETRRPLTAEQIRTRVAGYGQEDLGAFRRMFERDKSDLRQLGVPVETTPVDRWDDTPGYRIDPARYDLPPIRLRPDELTGLALAAQAAGLADEVSGALRKLEIDTGGGVPGHDLTPQPVGLALQASHRAELMEAQLARTTVAFRYAAPEGPPARRRVDPHGLVHRGGRWYLVGHDHDRDATRVFRLDRITSSVRAVGEPGGFPPPAQQVDADSVVPEPDEEPVTATVAAAEELAWQVARRARGGGTAHSPGWIRYELAPADPEELLGWLSAHGDQVRLLGPASLRGRLVARLEAILAATDA